MNIITLEYFNRHNKGGIIEVAELPTSAIDMGSFYRLTEDTELHEKGVYFYENDEWILVGKSNILRVEELPSTPEYLMIYELVQDTTDYVKGVYYPVISETDVKWLRLDNETGTKIYEIANSISYEGEMIPQLTQQDIIAIADYIAGGTSVIIKDKYDVYYGVIRADRINEEEYQVEHQYFDGKSVVWTYMEDGSAVSLKVVEPLLIDKEYADLETVNKTVIGAINELNSIETYQFKGYVSTTEPTGTIKDGELWYLGDEMPIEFPIDVKEYVEGAWSAETIQYSPDSLDLWADLENDHGYYWFGNHWNIVDIDIEVDGETIDFNEVGQIKVADEAIKNKHINPELKAIVIEEDDDDQLATEGAVYGELVKETVFELDESGAKDKLSLKVTNNDNKDIIDEFIEIDKVIIRVDSLPTAIDALNQSRFYLLSQDVGDYDAGLYYGSAVGGAIEWTKVCEGSILQGEVFPVKIKDKQLFVLEKDIDEDNPKGLYIYHSYIINHLDCTVRFVDTDKFDYLYYKKLNGVFNVNFTDNNGTPFVGMAFTFTPEEVAIPTYTDIEYIKADGSRVHACQAIFHPAEFVEVNWDSLAYKQLSFDNQDVDAAFYDFIMKTANIIDDRTVHFELLADVDKPALVDDVTIEYSEENKLQLKEQGIEFKHLHEDLTTDTIVAERENVLTTEMSVYKELLNNDDSVFEITDVDINKEKLTLTLVNNNGVAVVSKEVPLDKPLIKVEALPTENINQSRLYALTQDTDDYKSGLYYPLQVEGETTWVKVGGEGVRHDVIFPDDLEDRQLFVLERDIDKDHSKGLYIYHQGNADKSGKVSGTYVFDDAKLIDAFSQLTPDAHGAHEVTFENADGAYLDISLTYNNGWYVYYKKTNGTSYAMFNVLTNPSTGEKYVQWYHDYAKTLNFGDTEQNIDDVLNTIIHLGATKQGDNPAYFELLANVTEDGLRHEGYFPSDLEDRQLFVLEQDIDNDHPKGLYIYHNAQADEQNKLSGVYLFNDDTKLLRALFMATDSTRGGQYNVNFSTEDGESYVGMVVSRTNYDTSSVVELWLIKRFNEQGIPVDEVNALSCYSSPVQTPSERIDWHIDTAKQFNFGDEQTVDELVWNIFHNGASKEGVDDPYFELLADVGGAIIPVEALPAFAEGLDSTIYQVTADGAYERGLYYKGYIKTNGVVGQLFDYGYPEDYPDGDYVGQRATAHAYPELFDPNNPWESYWWDGTQWIDDDIEPEDTHIYHPQEGDIWRLKNISGSWDFDEKYQICTLNPSTGRLYWADTVAPTGNYYVKGWKRIDGDSIDPSEMDGGVVTVDTLPDVSAMTADEKAKIAKNIYYLNVDSGAYKAGLYHLDNLSSNTWTRFNVNLSADDSTIEIVDNQIRVKEHGLNLVHFERQDAVDAGKVIKVGDDGYFSLQDDLGKIIDVDELPESADNGAVYRLTRTSFGHEAGIYVHGTQNVNIWSYYSVNPKPDMPLNTIWITSMSRPVFARTVEVKTPTGWMTVEGFTPRPDSIFKQWEDGTYYKSNELTLIEMEGEVDEWLRLDNVAGGSTGGMIEVETLPYYDIEENAIYKVTVGDYEHPAGIYAYKVDGQLAGIISDFTTVLTPMTQEYPSGTLNIYVSPYTSDLPQPNPDVSQQIWNMYEYTDATGRWSWMTVYNHLIDESMIFKGDFRTSHSSYQGRYFRWIAITDRTGYWEEVAGDKTYKWVRLDNVEQGDVETIINVAEFPTTPDDSKIYRLTADFGDYKAGIYTHTNDVWQRLDNVNEGSIRQGEEFPTDMSDKELFVLEKDINVLNPKGLYIYHEGGGFKGTIELKHNIDDALQILPIDQSYSIFFPVDSRLCYGILRQERFISGSGWHNTLVYRINDATAITVYTDGEGWLLDDYRFLDLGNEEQVIDPTLASFLTAASVGSIEAGFELLADHTTGGGGGDDAVKSVNEILPDENGNVTLTGFDIQVDTLTAQPETVQTKFDILQDELNWKVPTSTDSNIVYGTDAYGERKLYSTTTSVRDATSASNDFIPTEKAVADALPHLYKHIFGVMRTATNDTIYITFEILSTTSSMTVAQAKSWIFNNGFVARNCVYPATGLAASSTIYVANTSGGPTTTSSNSVQQINGIFCTDASTLYYSFRTGTEVEIDNNRLKLIKSLKVF